MSRVTCTHRANGAQPPSFPNALYQSLSAGETSLNMVHYLWDRHADPVVDADFTPGAARWRPLLVVDRWVGAVHVRPPRAAHAWSLVSCGPSTLINAFVTGIPTGRLTAALDTDPVATGTYRVTFRMFGGATVVHHITTS